MIHLTVKGVPADRWTLAAAVAWKFGQEYSGGERGPRNGVTYTTRFGHFYVYRTSRGVTVRGVG